MKKFKHHSYFQKDKRLQRYLFPHACFACRKVFRKPYALEARRCPQCALPMTMLGRKFHAPGNSDRKQWRKVQLLVEQGFRFESVYRVSPEGGKVAVPYPKRISDVPAFIAEFQAQALRPLPVQPSVPKLAQSERKK